MGYLWKRLAMIGGMAMLSGCGGGMSEDSPIGSVRGSRGDLGAPCEVDGDCLSGICDDVSGAGAVCLEDVVGTVLVTCIQDDGSFSCGEDPLSALRFVRTIQGSLQLGYIADPVEVVLPNLHQVTDTVRIGEATIATDVALDGLVAVGGQVEIGFSTATRVSLARLESVGSSLTFAAMSDATAISLPSLESVGGGDDGGLTLRLLPSLVEFHVPVLRRVDGNLTVTDAPVLSEASMAALGAVEVTRTRDIQP